MLKKSSRQKYLVISHNSSPYVFDCFCTSGWNIFCQFWEGYPISPRLQHHFGSISGWGVKTSSDHCNKSLWFTQSGCNTGFRRMLRLLRKKWDQNKVNIAKPKKNTYNILQLLLGSSPKSTIHENINLKTFRIQSFLTSLDLPFISYNWRRFDKSAAEVHPKNIA